ncbi:MAG: CocE/NonD family hydrolase [Chloroflexota bacterium]
MKNKKLFSLLLLFMLVLNVACSSGGQPTTQPTQADAQPATPQPTDVALQPPKSESRCGDNICDGSENAENCPADCAGQAPTQAPPPGVPSLRAGGVDLNTYRVTNPTNGNDLFVRVLHPANWNGDVMPTLVLVPGGVGTIEPDRAQALADQGFVVVTFDPDGRGHSKGQEDFGGTQQQDGLMAVIRAITGLGEVDKGRIGVVSFSYGITIASGALARYPDLPVKFLIDWEGPADRYDTTMDCGPMPRVQWPSCSDDAAWSQREAITFISQIRIPYQRLQSEKDHMQPDNLHAVNIINAAVQGGVPWVRLNDYPPNQTYDAANPPAMLAETEEKNLEALIARFAQELFAM